MSRDGEFRVRVCRKTIVADGVVGLRLEPVSGAGPLPPWQPGAHIDLVAGNDLVRQYSLCGQADAGGFWEVAVLRVADGRGGSIWVHDKLLEGDELLVRGPRNHFRLEEAAAYLFIAGGIGVTPIVSMIRAAVRAGRPWRLAYGGRTRRSMAFAGELAQYGDAVMMLPQDEIGLLDLPLILGAEVPGRRVYCCGPESLLQAAETVMAARSLETLHLERFAPKEKDSYPGGAFDVEIASTGQRVHVPDGVSIIDALAGAGTEVDFSCGEGTCGTCETRVLAGVPQHRDSVLTPDEQAANDCMMICVGRCVRGPLVLDL